MSNEKVNNATERESAKALSDLEVVHEQQETMPGKSQPSQINIVEEGQEDQASEKPWYGTKRYEIVDKIYEDILEKERNGQLNPVQMASMRAQQQFMTTSIKELGDSYQGPKKYLSQRDAPLEIPFDVVQRLFLAMDQDLDDKVSMDELKNYIRQHEINIEDNIIEDMFRDAASVRRVVNDKQYNNPLEIEEICYAVRGRFQWDSNRKEWTVFYRKYRDYWLLLLLTVNERLFAL